MVPLKALRSLTYLRVHSYDASAAATAMSAMSSRSCGSSCGSHPTDSIHFGPDG
jgi:hypothetical protein